MGIEGTLLKPIDVGGVCPLLFVVSGYAATQRGSQLIEPRDLIKAIYIVDLEHVKKFWSDWEGFEKLVSNELRSAGRAPIYINRIWFLLQIQLVKGESDSITTLGRPSPGLVELVAAARKLASGRANIEASPSSQDLLFTACSQDQELSSALQLSGLQFDRLKAAVGPY